MTADYKQSHEWREPITMSIAESRAWRTEIPGWSDDILPFYDRLAKACSTTSRIVELGSAHGRSIVFLASKLLEQNKGGVELYAIDQWGGGWVEAARDIFKHATKEELAMVRFARLSSDQGSRLFEDDSLDVVFIDADHSYEAVKDDFRYWLPKVKPGGLLCGHDYSEKDNPGVVQAVNEAKDLHYCGGFGVDVTVWSMRKALT